MDCSCRFDAVRGHRGRAGVPVEAGDEAPEDARGLIDTLRGAGPRIAARRR